MRQHVRSLALLALALTLGACGDQPTEPRPDPGPDPEPTPAVTASFTTGGATRAGEPTTFDASASSDEAGGGIVYAWDFGDGVRGGSETIAHLYTEEGTYTVTLVVANAAGAADTVSRSLAISAPPAPTGTATLQGRVTDAAGDPLAGVTASLVGGTLAGTTDSRGTLSLPGFPAGVPATVKLTKSGYGERFVRVEIPDGSSEGHFIAALETRSAPAALSDAADGGTLSGPDGITISLPAGALVDGAGNPVTGAVQVSLTPVDVSGEAMRAFPGSRAALGPAGKQSHLRSLGVAEFELTQGGEALQIAAGETATIEIPLYSVGPNVGDSIALWSLDEKTAVWSQEGKGVVVASDDSPTGLALRATITHLSWWNAGEDNAPLDVAGWEALDALKQAMQARGLTPPPESGLSLDDYVQTTVTEGSDGGIRHARLWIGPEGNVIPTPEWQEYHPTYCEQRARYLQSAVKLLDFKIIQVSPGDYSAFAQHTDVATQVIGEQREGVGGSVVGALDAAWAQMNVEVGTLTDPCGEIRLVLVEGGDAGDEVVFQAGFQGSYGNSLSYTWDFGDGSAPVEGSKRMQHVYEVAGAYTVSVRVKGEDVEPGTATLRVVLGGDLVLSFDSRVEQQSPEAPLLIAHVAGTVTLALREDGSAYIGSGTIEVLQNTFDPGGDDCTSRLAAGTLEIDSLALPGMPGAAGEIELRFRFSEYPRRIITCTNESGTWGLEYSLFGMTYWVLRAANGELTSPGDVPPENIDEMQFVIRGWDTAVAEPLVARRVYDWSYSAEGTSLIENTTIEIRHVTPE